MTNRTSPYLNNPDAEPVRRHRIRQRHARRLLIAFTAALGVVAILLAFATISTLLRPAGTDTQTGGQVDSEGKPVAMDTLIRWLSTTPQPIPGGAFLSWDGVDVLEPDLPEPDDGEEIDPMLLPNYDIELHHFTVVDDQGDLYDASVTVHSNEELGAVVVGTPTAVRLPPNASEQGDWGNQDTWIGYETVQSTPEIVSAVDGWAAAYTSGDPSLLRREIGDQDQSRAYVPLGVAQEGTVEVAITDLGVRTPDDPDAEPDASQVLVRVEIAANFGDPVGDDAELQSQRRPVFTYDLLVVDATTATPRIVSWGAPGTGPTLTPYSVGVTGVEVATEQSRSPEATDNVTAPADETTSTQTSIP